MEVEADAPPAEPDARADAEGHGGEEDEGERGPDGASAQTGDEVEAMQALVQPAVAFGGPVEEAEERRPRGRALAGIDFHDVALGIPAALVIMVMPFTWNITNGIGFGFIAYVLVRLAQRRLRDIHPLMAAVSLAFAVYFVIPLLQDHFSWI